MAMIAIVLRNARLVRRTGMPRMTRAVRCRFPGNVISAKPIKNIGNPPGPGSANPTGQARRISTQPMMF